ncbi:MAG: Hpt domain-containing protein [Vulcanimicrobiaceae bacterium]
MIADVLQDTVLTLADLIGRLERSLESTEGSVHLAHEIKGVCLTVGAEEVAETSAEIERLAKHGEFEAIRRCLPALRDAERRLVKVVAGTP